VIVVDTSALIAILNKEPERDRLLDILANDDRPVLSAVTYYETMLIASARRGTANLDDLAQILETIEAEIVPFDVDQARAKQLAVPLLYKGSDFAATDIAAAG
jgi:ribonuclease VapC